MQPDPSGPAADAPVADTAETPSVAPDTGSTADGVSSVERPDEAQATEATPTPGDEPAEDSGETEETESESEDDRPRTEEERKLSRSERRALREQERIDAAVKAAIEAREREADAAKAKADQEAEARKAAEEETRELAEFLGEPDRADKPGTFATLQRERDDLNRQIHAELVNPQGADLDALAQQVAAKTAEIDRLTANNKMAAKLEAVLWRRFGGGFTAGAQKIEDPAVRQQYLTSRDVHEALEIRDAALVSQAEAKLKTTYEARIKAVEADRDAWKVRAAGGDVSVAQDGAPAPGGVNTREQFLALPKEQKDRMRRDQPELVAAIYARSA